MNDSLPTLNDDGTPRTGRGRKIALFGGAGLLLLLLGFVLMLPTFIGWGLFHDKVVGTIAAIVNGKVTIDSIEAGWGSGLAVRGLKIEDPERGTSIDATLSVEQGLWHVLTEGIFDLKLHAQGKVRTRRLPNGALSLSELVRTTVRNSVADADRSGAVKVELEQALPRGTDMSIAVDGITFEIEDASGQIESAVRDVKGAITIASGGAAALQLAGTTQVQGAAGEFSIDAAAPGIVNSKGELAIAGTPLTVKVSASNVALSAAGLDLRVADAIVDLKSTDLTGAIDATIAMHASVDGSAPASLDVKLLVAQALNAKGEFILDLAGVTGSVRAGSVPLAPLQRFLAETPLVLVRDAGARADLEATFARASGAGLQLELRSDKLRLHAEGSVDPATRAATFAKVTLEATVDPALLRATAGLELSAPSLVSITATEVVVPASNADGTFPVDALRFVASGAATLPGIRVNGPDGLIPVAVDSASFTLAAKPLGETIQLDVRAKPTAGAAGQAASGTITLEGTLHKGGAFGWNGSLHATQIPCALLDPWMPKGIALQPSVDLGSSISALDASVAAGDAPAMLLAIESPLLTVRADGTVAANGAASVKSARLQLRSVRPALLSEYGVRVDAPLSVAAELRDLVLPASKDFDLATLACDAEITVARAGAVEPLTLTVGEGASARTLRVAPLHLKASTGALGSDASVTLEGAVEGVPLTAAVRAQQLIVAGSKGAGGLALEGANFTISAQLTGIGAGVVGRELPDLQGIVANFGEGRLDLAATMEGKLQDGRAIVRLSAPVRAPGQASEIALDATLRKASVDATATASIEVTPKLLAAAAPTLPIKLDAPTRLESRAEGISLKRTGLWALEAPAQVQVTARVPMMRATGISGLLADLELGMLEARSAVTLSPRMAARGTLSTAVTALPLPGEAGGARPAAERVGDLQVAYGWTVSDATTPAVWDADLSLTNLRGKGVEALIDLGEAARGEIGDGGHARVRASRTPTGAIAFDIDSEIPRMRALLKGDLQGEILTLSQSSLNLSIPGPQVVAMLNRRAAAAADPETGPDGKVRKPAPAWKTASALEITAEIPSFRMDVVPDHKPTTASAPPDAPEPPPAPAEQGADELPPPSGAIPAFTLPNGFAAVARITMKPLRLTPTEGAPITVEALTLTADAPGVAQPASFKLDAALTDGAGKRAPIAVNATLRDWADAKGVVDFKKIQMDATARVTEASSAVLGALSGKGNEFVEALGPTATFDASVKSTGPGAATAQATLTSQFLQLQAPQIILKDGFVLVAAAKPVRLTFIPSDPLRKRLLEPINPIFRDVRLADNKKPILFQATALRYPLDGDYAKCDGQFDLTVGDVLVDRNPSNDILNLLKAFQSRDGQPIDGRIDPLRVTVTRGQLKYNNFDVYLEKQGTGWVTKLIFSGDVDLTRKPAFARSIAANYPLSSVARSVINLLPNDEGGGTVADALNVLSLGATDAVQLKVTLKGPLGEVDGKSVPMQRKIKVVFVAKAIGSGLENTAKEVGGLIGDLFGGNKKKNAPKK